MEEDEGDEDDEEENDGAGSEAGPSGTQAEEAEAEEVEEEAVAVSEPQLSSAPPRILITTSPGPSKPTYHFCDDLKSIFPGGEFFKRPKGRGFELGRVARWSAKRGYSAVIVVNEDHKTPSEYNIRCVLTHRRYHTYQSSCWSNCILQADECPARKGDLRA